MRSSQDRSDHPLSNALYERDEQEEQDTEQDDEVDTSNPKTTTEKIRSGVVYSILSLAALYFFMVAVKLIGDGFTLALG
ncbi:Sodium-dependent phosphate transporter, partial [Globisporangium polare]